MAFLWLLKSALHILYYILLLLVATVFIFIANVNISVVMQNCVYRFCITDFFPCWKHIYLFVSENVSGSSKTDS